MRRKFLTVVAVMVCLVCVLSMSGCTEDKAARKALEGMFAELQEGNYDGARKYISQREGTNDFLSAANKFNEKDIGSIRCIDGIMFHPMQASSRRR